MPGRPKAGISFAECKAFVEVVPKQPLQLTRHPNRDPRRFYAWKAKSRNLDDGYGWKRPSFQLSQNLFAECKAFVEVALKQPKALEN